MLVLSVFDKYCESVITSRTTGVLNWKPCFCNLDVPTSLPFGPRHPKPYLGPANYPLLYREYLLFRTIRALLQRTHWGGPVLVKFRV